MRRRLIYKNNSFLPNDSIILAKKTNNNKLEIIKSFKVSKNGYENYLNCYELTLLARQNYELCNSLHYIFNCNNIDYEYSQETSSFRWMEFSSNHPIYIYAIEKCTIRFNRDAGKIERFIKTSSNYPIEISNLKIECLNTNNSLSDRGIFELDRGGPVNITNLEITGSFMFGIISHLSTNGSIIKNIKIIGDNSSHGITFDRNAPAGSIQELFIQNCTQGLELSDQKSYEHNIQGTIVGCTQISLGGANSTYDLDLSDKLEYVNIYGTYNNLKYKGNIGVLYTENDTIKCEKIG